jgi:transposase
MRRVEILMGAERRRRWSDADKLAVLKEATAPGISAAAVARRHDLFPQQLYRWRRQFGFGRRRRDEGKTGTPIAFLPLELVAAGGGGERSNKAPVPAPPHPTRRDRGSEPWAEIVLANGRRLRVAPRIDEANLARLIRVVETA